MKKALIVCTIGGFLGFELNNIKILHEMGYKIYIATNFKGYEYIKEKLLSFETCNIQVDFTRKPVSFSNVKAYKKLEKILARERFDLVHCHTPVGGVLARLAAKKHRKRGTKVIYTVHGFHFFKGAPIKNWILYYPIEKILSRWTDVLVTINKEDYGRAKRRLCAKKIEYVPGVGVDVEFFQKYSGGTVTRERLQVPENAVILLSVGELNKNKNQEIVIRALSSIKEWEIYYILCGTGNKQAYLERTAEELGIRDRVLFQGFCHNIVEYYKLSDIFVFPSRREGLPVALMEAMACGLPCVASDIRGNRDLIQNNKNGYLCKDNIAEEYKKYVELLIARKTERSYLGGKAAEDIKKYRKERAAGKMKKIYEREAKD